MTTSAPLEPAAPSARGAAPGRSVLVTNAGRGSALAFVRSLGRAGYRVIAADVDPRSPGFRSRHAHERVVYPDPKQGPRRYARALRDIVVARRVDLVVPVSDETLLPLAQVRKDFEGLCALAIPEPAALEAVADKWQTLEWARRLSVPVPRTELVRSSAEAVAAAGGLRAPFVLKPRRSRCLHEERIEAFEVAYARDRTDLAAAMRRFEGRCDVLLQEFVRGGGAGVEILAHAGRPLLAFQHRRLRELPLHGGRSSLRESAPLDPTLYSASRRLLEALDWTGLAMVEFKLAEGGPVLMEVNGRVWGSLPLAVHSGVDFPRRLAELYLPGSAAGSGPAAKPRQDLDADPAGREAPSPTPYAIAVQTRNLELELKWIVSMLLGRRRLAFLPGPSRREVVAALVSLLDPRVHSDVQSLADPAPGLADLRRIARVAVRWLRGERA